MLIFFCMTFTGQTKYTQPIQVKNTRAFLLWIQNTINNNSAQQEQTTKCLTDFVDFMLITERCIVWYFYFPFMDNWYSKSHNLLSSSEVV